MLGGGAVQKGVAAGRQMDGWAGCPQPLSGKTRHPSSTADLRGCGDDDDILPCG